MFSNNKSKIIIGILVLGLAFVLVVYLYKNTDKQIDKKPVPQTEEPRSDRVSFDCEAPNSCVPRLSCDKQNRMELALCEDTQAGDLVCCSQ